MAILGGCDYLDSINGIGIKTAHQLLRKYKSAKKAIQSVRLNAKLTVPRDYERLFSRADLTFQYQCVYDPLQQSLVHLNPVPEAGLSEEDYLAVGGGLTPEMAKGIACGDMDPITKQKMVDIFPDSVRTVEAATSISRPASISQYRKHINGSTKEAGTNDIRKFFGAAPKACQEDHASPNKEKKKRKALSQVSANELPSKKRKLSPVKKSSSSPGLSSRFFGRKPSQLALVSSKSASIVVLNDEDDEAENSQHADKLVISMMSDVTPKEAQQKALSYVAVSQQQQEEAKQALRQAHDRLPCQDSETKMMEYLEEDRIPSHDIAVITPALERDTDQSESEPPFRQRERKVEPDSEGNSITSPVPSSPAAVSDRKDNGRESSEVALSSPDCALLPPLVTAKDADHKLQFLASPDKREPLLDVTSDIADFSEPPLPKSDLSKEAEASSQAKKPLQPTPKGKSARKTQARAAPASLPRLPKQENVLVNPKTAATLEDDASDYSIEGATSITAIWRARFTNPGVDKVSGHRLSGLSATC